MAAKSKKPEIRFAGFEDEWEQRKLGNIAEIVSGGTPDTNNPDYWDGEINWYAPAEISDQIFVIESERKITELGLKKSSAKMLPAEKTILFTSRAGIGKVAILGYSACTNQGFQSLVLKEGNEPYFVYSMGNQLKEKAEAIASGSTFLEISGKMLANLDIMIPNREEQIKIASYFQQLDNLITLNQRKHEKLVTTKKAMLEKLFPQGDSNTPELRFSGFKGSWKQRKIGDCFFERTESMPNGELLSVTTNDGIKKFSEIGRHDNSNDDKSKYKRVCIGDIAYNSMRMWQGASGYSPYDGIVSPAYTVLAPNQNVDSKCTSYLFKRPDTVQIFRRNSQGITSDNWNLKFPTLSEIKIMLAKSLEEQRQIANCLQCVDSLIILQQQKVQKLKNIKSACMEKMFV